MYLAQMAGRGMNGKDSGEEMNQERTRETERSRWKWDSARKRLQDSRKRNGRDEGRGEQMRGD